MRVRFSAQSEIDLLEIADFIALDSPARALSFVRELRAACRRIGRMPAGYRLRPELGRDIRSCAVKSYVIFFVIVGSETVVARVLHGARDIGADDFKPQPGSADGST
jgi:toxin ParE1/3/4